MYALLVKSHPDKRIKRQATELEYILRAPKTVIGVARCRLIVSNPVLKAPTISALEPTIS